MNAGSKSRSFENYPRDIVDRVIHEFPADAVGQVHLWLEDLSSDRLSRCALFLAAGSLEKLEEAVSLGRTDYRDLIVAAEYDQFRIQLRDFNRPFGDEGVPNPLEFQMRRNQANQTLQGTPAKAPSSSTEPDGRRS